MRQMFKGIVEGYDNAWANDLGEYIVSESPSYNPNIESNQHWEQLTPAK